MNYRDAVVNAAYVPVPQQRRYANDDKEKDTDSSSSSQPAAAQCPAVIAPGKQVGYTMGAVLLAMFICGVIGVIVGYIMYSSVINPLIREQRAMQATLRDKVSALERSMDALYQKAGKFDRAADVEELYKDVKMREQIPSLEEKFDPLQITENIRKNSSQETREVVTNLCTSIGPVHESDFNTNFELQQETFKLLQTLPKNEFCTKDDYEYFLVRYRLFTSRYPSYKLPYSEADIRSIPIKELRLDQYNYPEKEEGSGFFGETAAAIQGVYNWLGENIALDPNVDLQKQFMSVSPTNE